MEDGLPDRRGRIRERLPAAALVGLGLAALYEASHLPFGTMRQPDSGFYPILVCVALTVFGVCSVAEAPPPSEEVATDSGGQARVWLVIVALAVYAWALVPVGFLLCTAALLVLLLRGIGRVPWAAAVASAALASIACYGLFTRLGLPLPAGLLGF